MSFIEETKEKEASKHHFSQAIKSARKEHICYICKGQIAFGDKYYQYTTILDSNPIKTDVVKVCDACNLKLGEGRNDRIELQPTEDERYNHLTPGGWPDGDWENRIPTPKGELHRKICEELNNTYKAKNADYGDSFAMVRSKYPNAIMVRLWDKVNRLETLLNGKQAEVDESIEDTLKDLAGYATMEMVERRLDKTKRSINDGI